MTVESLRASRSILMAMHEPRFGARRILFPILYAASAPTMFVLSFLLVSLLVGQPPVIWVFVVFNVCLVRIEHMKSPGILDHLRYCAILYAGLVPLGFSRLRATTGVTAALSSGR